MDDAFAQAGFRCRLEWGWHGAQIAAERGDILVVVDTLRFSTTAVTAVHHGVILFPCLWNEDIVAFARRVDAIPGGNRTGEDRRFTLSPLDYLQLEAGVRVALASPNGATCARYAQQVPFLLVGTLLNAQATANRVSSLLRTTELNVTLLACGERWRDGSIDGNLRFAIEDYLGAGAILHYLKANLEDDANYQEGNLSPEAEVCAGAFRNVFRQDNGDGLLPLLWECGSGRELRAKGLANDVVHAARLNLYNTVPMMRDQCLIASA
jgi:2-phosphosulfolactate phosphatase